MATATELARVLIRHFEGCKLEAYKDQGGVWTIGYGHTVGVKKGDSISYEQAAYYLTQDIAQAFKDMHALVKVPLTAHEQAALISWLFNFGRTKVRGSTLIKKLNAKRPSTEIINELLRWDKGMINGVKKQVPGLTRRRKTEAHLYMTGQVDFSIKP